MLWIVLGVAPVVFADSPWTPTPCPVEQERVVCLLGVALDEETGEMINIQVTQRDGFEVTQYLLPDFGYVLALNFSSPSADRWVDTSDAIAATMMGC